MVSDTRFYEWILFLLGDHKIEVKYLDIPIKDSPFLCQVWDHNQIVVSGIAPARVAKACFFNSTYPFVIIIIMYLYSASIQLPHQERFYE